MLKALLFFLSITINLNASQYDLPIGENYVNEIRKYTQLQKEAFGSNDIQNFKIYTTELSDLLTLKKYDKTKISFREASDKEKKDIYKAIFQIRKTNTDKDDIYKEYNKDEAKNLGIILKIDNLAKDFFSTQKDESNLSDWVKELLAKNTYKDMEIKELSIISNLYKIESFNFHNDPIFKSLETEVSKLNIGGDVHILDSWVAKNIGNYIQFATDALSNINIKIDEVKIEDFINKFKINTPFTILDDKSNNEVEITKDDASQRFSNSINHMFSLGNQGSVKTLLNLNYANLNYLSKIYSYNDYYFYINQFQKQIIDAHTTCLQGQTNRLLISLHTCLNGANELLK